MPQSTIVGNWKMNTTIEEARALVTLMRSDLESLSDVQTVVCPPFISLAVVAEMLRGSRIGLGAQNLYFEPRGAFTGEISPAMLGGLCQFVILGHSERRRLFGESDDVISQKVRAALEFDLTPILCLGETLDEREAGRAESTVERQVQRCLAGVGAPPELFVAYEPVWAIGAGQAATPAVAQGMMAHLRTVLASIYGDSFAEDIPLLYGGSVTPGNVAGFAAEKDIDGALVGGASLDAASFVEIVQQTARAKD